MSPLTRKEISFRAILYYSGIFLTIGVFVCYALFQARFILAGPQITFTNQPATIQTERLITLEGTAKNIVRLTLNGRQIYTDKDGYFKEALVLENGYTVATLQAHDRYKHERSYTQEFVYTPSLTLQ